METITASDATARGRRLRRRYPSTTSRRATVKKPRSRVLAGQRLGMPPRPQQRLLHDVLGLVAVAAEEPLDVFEQRARILGVERIEQLLLVRACGHAPHYALRVARVQLRRADARIAMMRADVGAVDRGARGGGRHRLRVGAAAESA
jgi:hypothetical protein